MSNMRTTLLLAFLNLFFVACSRDETRENSHFSEALRTEAVSELKRVLTDTLRWEKVHAAEYLMELQYFDQIKEVFLREEKIHGKEPSYRVGIWRVLAQVPALSAERNQWIDRIHGVYKDRRSIDRAQAAESLAKLKHPFTPVAEEKDPVVKLFAEWAGAYASPKTAATARTELMRLIMPGSRAPRERKVAAYALRHLGPSSYAETQAISNLALSEPDSSEVRAYLLSAAIHHLPVDSLSRNRLVYDELVRLASGGSKSVCFEVEHALAVRGASSDIPLLTGFLKGTSDNRFTPAEEADIRAGAAYALLRIDRRIVPSLSLPDWVVIAVYGLLMLWIGWFYSRRNKTREDYLLGGRKMNPVAVGISLFATLLSTLSYLSYPGEMIKNGPAIFAGMFALPFVYFAVGWWLIPRIMKMNVTSAYEILERKFGLPARMMATFMFLSLRFLWMATIIYVTVEIALFSVVPFDKAYALPIGIVLMLITIVYTAMGGLKAVVVTDVLQSVIFLGGALISVLLVCYHFGSFTSWLPDSWPVSWEPPRYGFDARERSTVGNAMLMLFVWYVCTTGSDQMAIQRYLATKDIKAARKSLGVSLYTNLLAKCLLGLVGLAVFAFFTRNPHLLADGKTLQDQADTLFPRFILVGLPVGLSGLVIAGLLAAAMSSLSSGVNSVSSVISEDIVQRFRKSVSTREGLLKQVKLLSYFTGGFVMVLSIFIGNVEGNLFDVVTKVVNLFVGPLFVLFFMALFVPFSTSAGAILGGVISVIAACAVAFYGVFGITVFWILPVSLLVGAVTGTLVSFIETRFINSKNNAE
ncbi:hypothetical protein GCM10023091_37180 [Ravibacter arvi]|uniref:Uncharacterized protein n=1 Tax=Ravibacter arvi TaxID=2051041 RepID=A0ABP8M914_9BACT